MKMEIYKERRKSSWTKVNPAPYACFSMMATCRLIGGKHATINSIGIALENGKKSTRSVQSAEEDDWIFPNKY
jgi:hypothetical protein